MTQIVPLNKETHRSLIEWTGKASAAYSGGQPPLSYG